MPDLSPGVRNTALRQGRALGAESTGTSGGELHKLRESPGLCPRRETAACLRQHPHLGVPIMAQQVTNRTGIHEDAGFIPGLKLSGLRIQHGHELRCRLQMQLRSHLAVAVAVAVAGNCSSDPTPSLRTSICCRCSPKKKKKKKEY